jgi:hypothetical protein
VDLAVRGDSLQRVDDAVTVGVRILGRAGEVPLEAAVAVDVLGMWLTRNHALGLDVDRQAAVVREGQNGDARRSAAV